MPHLLHHWDKLILIKLSLNYASNLVICDAQYAPKMPKRKIPFIFLLEERVFHPITYLFCDVFYAPHLGLGLEAHWPMARPKLLPPLGVKLVQYLCIYLGRRASL